MWISKAFTRTKQKVLLLWFWNSVNEAIMLLPKDVSNNFTKTMLSLSDISEMVSDE